MTTQEKLDELRAKDAKAFLLGGEKAIDKQHAKGKYTARERLDLLLDKDSFHEVGRFVKHQCVDFGMMGKDIPADGVITGYGTVDGRTVFVYSQDFTASGGSMGKAQAMKICRVMDMAAEAGAPMIGINDSGGARIQEGVDSLAGYGEIFRRNSQNSGKIPQITMIMGPCAGGASYSPAITDLVVMLEKHGQMFCTGPGVIKDTTGDIVDAETLGGAMTHATLSGEVHLTAKTEEEAFAHVRKMLSYLPSSCMDQPVCVPYEPADEARPSLNTIVPESKYPYDMQEVIRQITDKDSFTELQPLFADNLIVGFARIGGRPVGIIANQPYVMAGCLEMNSADKGARFVNLCNAFNLPIVSLVDVPGFMPGVEEEHLGVLRHGAKMLYAFSVAEVPKIQVLIRKAYGGAYMAMGSKELGSDLVFAWPTAELAVMGSEGAVNVVYRKEIAEAEDQNAKRKELAQEFTDKFSNPYVAASRGYIDAVIAPEETRKELIAALELLKNKPHKEHRGNMPL